MQENVSAIGKDRNVLTKDWTGNTKSAYTIIGAKGHTQKERELNDYYATDPKALEELLKTEHFDNNIWECACGGGHLSKVLEQHGYNVLSTDIINRGYGTGGIDFLDINEPFNGDIITNPPYKYAKEFVQHAIDLITDGHRVAMFLKLQFLEGKSRRKLFDKYPPKYVYVSSSRIECLKNGDEKNEFSSAIAYAWFIWEKPFSGEPTIRWFN